MSDRIDPEAIPRKTLGGKLCWWWSRALAHDDALWTDAESSNPLLRSILRDVSAKTLWWRATAAIASAAALFASIVLAVIALGAGAGAGSAAASQIVPGVLLIGLLLGLWALCRSFWGVAHAYATRAGQLEDIELVLDLAKRSDVTPEQALKIVAELRRAHLGEVLRSATPKVELQLKGGDKS